MTKHTLSTRYLVPLLVFFSRFNILPANFSAAGSFGFFSKNPTLFAFTVLFFDILKGGFYKGFLWTYLGFAAYYVLGRVAANNTKRQVVLLPLASLVFFILSSIGVWWFWFPQTLEGLIACFAAALPFYRNTFISDILFGYGALIFKKVLATRTKTQEVPTNILATATI